MAAIVVLVRRFGNYPGRAFFAWLLEEKANSHILLDIKDVLVRPAVRRTLPLLGIAV